jgi:hypothetical protein
MPASGLAGSWLLGVSPSASWEMGASRLAPPPGHGGRVAEGVNASSSSWTGDLMDEENVVASFVVGIIVVLLYATILVVLVMAAWKWWRTRCRRRRRGTAGGGSSGKYTRAALSPPQEHQLEELTAAALVVDGLSFGQHQNAVAVAERRRAATAQALAAAALAARGGGRGGEEVGESAAEVSPGHARLRSLHEEHEQAVRLAHAGAARWHERAVAGLEQQQCNSREDAHRVEAQVAAAAAAGAAQDGQERALAAALAAQSAARLRHATQARALGRARRAAGRWHTQAVARRRQEEAVAAQQQPQQQASRLSADRELEQRAQTLREAEQTHAAHLQAEAKAAEEEAAAAAAAVASPRPQLRADLSAALAPRTRGARGASAWLAAVVCGCCTVQACLLPAAATVRRSRLTD